MATTKKGIYYPTDYTKPADVPDDMKKLAESVDEAIGNIPQYDDTGIKKDISDLKKEQSTQKQQISDNSKKNTQQDTEISKLQTRVQQLQANMINETTEEATSLHVTNSAELPAKLSVKGNHRQETREGYNIFDYLNHIRASISGLTTTTDKEGYITVNGTPTAGYANIVVPIDITDLLEDNTTYTLWQDSYSETKYGGVYLQCNIKKKSDSSITYLDASKQKTMFTVNKSQYTYTANLQIGTTAVAGTFSNYKNRYMIYKGTDNKDYQLPGVSPSINYPSEVEAVGDNKFDGEVLIGKGYNSSTGALQDNSYAFCNKNMIEVKPSAKLTISQNRNIFSTRFFFYNENKEYLSDAVNNSESIDVPNNCYYVNFQATKEAVRENYNNIKIELSNYTGNIQGYERITKMNKNFFNVPSSNSRGVDLELQEDGLYKINGTSTTNWVYRYGDYIWLTKGKYTISVENLNVGNTFFGIRGAGIKYETSTNYTFTLQKDSLVRCYFTCANAVNFENAVVKVQLEKSEAKTEWVKHEEESYVLDVQQEMLQGDYFIKEADGWKEVHLREKGFIKDDISNALLSGLGNLIYIPQLLQDTAKIPANNNEDALILSNFALHSPQTNLASASIDYGIALSDTGSLCIRCKNLSTVDEYKTALNNDSYYYYYYLATPSKLACTEAQSKVLDQLSELELFKGTNNIITAENLALLQITYTVDTKAYIDSKLGSEG